MGARASFRKRLRLAFALLVITILAIAIALVLFIGRGANERDALKRARAVAESAATSAAAEIGRALNTDQVDVGLVARGLDRAYRVIDAELIRVSAQGARAASNNADGAPPARLVPALNLLTGEPFETVIDGEAFVAVPLEFSNNERQRLGLGDDVLAVVATSELGPAGLGPLGPALLLTAFLALPLSALLAEFLARRIRRPLQAVASTSEAISGGDLTARVDLPSTADREVANIAETIDDLATRLQASSEQRRQFLLDVSHELRTPLTSVRGYAELLADGDIEDPADVAAAGLVVGREATRMERLVEDLLTLARLDAGDMAVEPSIVDLGATVRNSTMAFATRADARGVELRLPPDDAAVRAIGDPTRVSQVVANLVSNAIDYARTTVLVRVERQDDLAMVQVTDDGPGLGPDPAGLFERHRQGAQPLDRQAGLGVGLSIVEGFVNAMDGTVSATSGAEGGSTFTVTLPAPPP